MYHFHHTYSYDRKRRVLLNEQRIIDDVTMILAFYVHQIVRTDVPIELVASEVINIAQIH